MITRRDIMWAIADIDRERGTDVFPYCIDFDELIADDKIEETIRKVFEMNRDITRVSAAQFAQKHNIKNIHSTVPKKTGVVRNAILIDPFLNIYYLALAIRIRKKSPKFHSHSVSNIYPGVSESLSNNRSNFSEFCWTNHWLATSNHHKYSLILKLCIANFFESISIDLIKQAITCSDVDKLCALLEVVGGRGLPVGGNASRIIGELIVAYTDKWLIEQKILFNRHVDDYVMFFDNSQDTFGLLTEFENHLSQFSLRLNHVKTKAYPIDLRYIFKLPAFELSELQLSQSQGKYYCSKE